MSRALRTLATLSAVPLPTMPATAPAVPSATLIATATPVPSMPRAAGGGSPALKRDDATQAGRRSVYGTPAMDVYIDDQVLQQRWMEEATQARRQWWAVLLQVLSHR